MEDFQYMETCAVLEMILQRELFFSLCEPLSWKANALRSWTVENTYFPGLLHSIGDMPASTASIFQPLLPLISDGMLSQMFEFKSLRSFRMGWEKG